MSDKPLSTQLDEVAGLLMDRLPDGSLDVVVRQIAAEVRSLERGVAGLVPEGMMLVPVLDCPNPRCDNQGFEPVQVGDEEWEQSQCEFCYTVPNSRFNLEEAVRDAGRKV